MNLFLIRHLPTTWNKKQKLQGSKDIPIAPISTTDALAITQLKNQLANWSFDQILVSEKKRTQQTAMAVGYTAFTIEPLLNELHFGKYEGLPKSTLLEAAGDSWYNACLTLELGEKLSDFQDRLLQFIAKYKEYQRVLVFGHGAFIRGLITLQQKGNINQMNQLPIANLQLTILEVMVNN